MYCDPVEGRLPAEGTEEAATDTRVLELLGITPELGAEFTLALEVDGRETTQTFTLCGWWEYDEAVTASHVLIPHSRVEAVLAETGVTPDVYKRQALGVDLIYKSLRQGHFAVEGVAAGLKLARVRHDEIAGGKVGDIFIHIKAVGKGGGHIQQHHRQRQGGEDVYKRQWLYPANQQ